MKIRLPHAPVAAARGSPPALRGPQEGGYTCSWGGCCPDSALLHGPMRPLLDPALGLVRGGRPFPFRHSRRAVPCCLLGMSRSSIWGPRLLVSGDVGGNLLPSPRYGVFVRGIRIRLPHAPVAAAREDHLQRFVAHRRGVIPVVGGGCRLDSALLHGPMRPLPDPALGLVRGGRPFPLRHSPRCRVAPSGCPDLRSG
ncbi:hypothetical protein NDU88_006562 [Pleurodeles waltl]|uniref:Uncharacterized protein n=1 Tax=Pleurodeles waltl TaxID=8319 RepID=A0AAV7LQ03_PLEWA|nr:hypothetical protein NDU88_006562 [Pleurodeles waltl]